MVTSVAYCSIPPESLLFPVWFSYERLDFLKSNPTYLRQSLKENRLDYLLYYYK